MSEEVRFRCPRCREHSMVRRPAAEAITCVRLPCQMTVTELMLRERRLPADADRGFVPTQELLDRLAALDRAEALMRFFVVDAVREVSQTNREI